MKIIKKGDKFVIDFEGLKVDCGDMFNTNVTLMDLFNFDNVLTIENGHFDFCPCEDKDE
jgi:hypothetical protein